MGNQFARRNFLKGLMNIPLAASAGALLNEKSIFTNKDFVTAGSKGLKTSLNAFSFNVPLANGSMTMDDLLTAGAGFGFDAVDITGYYFKGYPVVPTDEYLYNVKRKAFGLGLDIS